MSFQFHIPVPETLEQLTWFLIGFLFARAFAKKLDHNITQSAWYNEQNSTVQWLIKRTLDFLHHFWIGLLIVIYAPKIVGLLGLTDPTALLWFAYGLILDDLPDIPSRFRGYFQYLFK